jgi:hypothetical protein
MRFVSYERSDPPPTPPLGAVRRTESRVRGTISTPNFLGPVPEDAGTTPVLPQDTAWRCRLIRPSPLPLYPHVGTDVSGFDHLAVADLDAPRASRHSGLHQEQEMAGLMRVVGLLDPPGWSR